MFYKQTQILVIIFVILLLSHICDMFTIRFIPHKSICIQMYLSDV